MIKMLYRTHKTNYDVFAFGKYYLVDVGIKINQDFLRLSVGKTTTCIIVRAKMVIIGRKCLITDMYPCAMSSREHSAYVKIDFAFYEGYHIIL